MDKIRNYNISFSGLKNGKHHFEFPISQAFFDLFETEKEFTNAQLVSEISLEKHATFLDFVISINGKLTLICDISNEEFEHFIENEIKVLVKFGEEYDDSNEEIITIPHTDSEFNVAQLIYEAVTLAIPMKKISPNTADNDEYQTLLEKFSPKINEEIEENADIDPRWAALQQLKK